MLRSGTGFEDAQARTAAAPGAGSDALWRNLRRLTTENTALKKQLADGPGVGPAEEAAAGRLMRDRLKEALAKKEAQLAADPG